jgi:hypothetical protein
MNVLDDESTGMIRNFTLIEEIEHYDKAGNPLHLSVRELLPVGVKWNCNGREYEIQNGNKLTAKVLNDRKYIAIIECSDNKKLNEAYIVDGTNIQKYNIRKLLDENDLEIRPPHITGENNRIKLNKDTLIFYDVYYEGRELYFYVIIGNEDYRFSFDLETGGIGELAASK